LIVSILVAPFCVVWEISRWFGYQFHLRRNNILKLYWIVVYVALPCCYVAAIVIFTLSALFCLYRLFIETFFITKWYSFLYHLHADVIPVFT